MGGQCSGDRKGYVPMDELWVQTFREISLRTRRIYMSAIQHVRSGRISQDKLKDYCEAEIKSVRLLPQELLDALWQKYDKNKDGQLTLDEFKELVDDYLRHAEKEAPQELAETMLEHFTASGMTDEEARKYIDNPAVRERMEQTRAALLHQIEKWRANIRSVIDNMLQQLSIGENAYIPREAFMKSFANVCESVCDLNTFKGTLFNVHATGADNTDLPAITPRRRRRMSFMDTYAC